MERDESDAQVERNVDECQYRRCNGDPSVSLDGPDGRYWMCPIHARQLVLSPHGWDFDWDYESA